MKGYAGFRNISRILEEILEGSSCESRSFVLCLPSSHPRLSSLGLSAGAASSSLQTAGNGGNSENLFHGVWAESGALQHLPRIDEPVAQVVFDNFVAAVNCSDAPEDQVLQCIRDIDTTGLQNVVGTSNHAFWDVAVDGTFLQESPQRALAQGKIANVPIVTGTIKEQYTFNGT